MVDFFRSLSVNRVCLFCTAVSFSLSTLPIQAAPPITIGDIVYAVKLQNLAEKMKKYANRSDNSKLIKTMFEFKQEAEACLNAKINMDEMLNMGSLLVFLNILLLFKK